MLGIAGLTFHWLTTVNIGVAPVKKGPPQAIAAMSPSQPQPEAPSPGQNRSPMVAPAPDQASAFSASNAQARLRRDALAADLQARQERLAQIRDWAAKDLDGALASVLKMPAGPERDDALQAVCFGFAQTHPAQAVELAQTLQQPGIVVENLVQQWGASDLPSALAWANDQPAGDQHDQFVQRLALDLSKTDPANAAGLVAEQIPPGPAQDEAVMTVIQQWGNQDLAAAAAWVKTFPAGPLQARATEELENILQYKNN